MIGFSIGDVLLFLSEYADTLYVVFVVGLVLAVLERGISWFRKGADRE